MFRLEETIQQLNNKVERVANALENLQTKVKETMKLNMKVIRELVIKTASRMFTGLEVMGCPPVLVTFEYFKAREEVINYILMKGVCL